MVVEKLQREVDHLKGEASTSQQAVLETKREVVRARGDSKKQVVKKFGFWSDIFPLKQVFRPFSLQI